MLSQLIKAGIIPKLGRFGKDLPRRANADAQYGLGYMYGEGKGEEKNDVKFVKWMKLAADNGHCRAPFWVGFDSVWGLGPSRWDEAAKWYRLSADRGDPEAQSDLANQYEHGEGVLQDYVQAAHWYKLAAEQGNDTAQELLADMYEDGRGVKQDFVQAHKWYNISATTPLKKQLGGFTERH